jgi:hypothetical protein
VRNQGISSRIARLALILGLCGLPSLSCGYGRPNKPSSVKQSRYEDLPPSVVSSLAGRSFEYWADREVRVSGGCDTPESQFRTIPHQLRCTVAFSQDGRAIDLTLADKTVGPVSLDGLRDRQDGSAIYQSSTSFLAFRVSIDGSSVRAELTFHGSGVCVVRRTRGTLRPGPASGRSGV